VNVENIPTVPKPPSTLDVQALNIPDELLARAQWVVWKWKYDKKKTRPWTKVPCRASSPSDHASSTDPATWATFGEAFATHNAHADISGIGYVFSADDPYTGVDLDDIFLPEENGEQEIHPVALELIHLLDSYTELSPTETGAKVILHASMNGHNRHSAIQEWGGKLEVYDQSRFFTITGHRFDTAPAEIKERGRQLASLLLSALPEPELVKTVARATTPAGLDDRALLAKAFVAKDGADFERLWAGEILDGKSHSEADIALCGKLAFWTNGDSDEVDRLFRSSGLMRDKWDERRNGSTYGADTIVKAIASRNGFYDPAHSTATKADTGNSDDPGYRRLSGIDMRSIKFLDKPLFQQSAFQLIAGKKGSGKGTYIALIAKKTTRGELFGRPMNVLIVSSEDSASIDIRPRVEAAGGDSERVYIVTKPFILPRDLDWLKHAALEIGDVGLIAIDPIGNHLGGENTDAEGKVRDAISGLNDVADELGCLLIGVRHLKKDTKAGALSSVLGSTAWVDVPRAVLALAADDVEDLLFHIQVVAGNRGPNGQGRAFRIELADVGLDEPVTKAIEIGVSEKSVEQLLGETSSRSNSAQARARVLELLEGVPQMESDQLDATVAQETGLAAKTIRNIRTKLGDEGLIKMSPDKDEFGEIEKWQVMRTLAGR
jgi:putative DNA primase/helicase